MKRPRAQSGVTLAELVIVVTVLAILATFAVPAGLDWWQRETVIVLADRFASAVSLARATARNRRVWVNLGPRDAAQGWSSGWALYTTPSPQVQVVRREPGPDDVLLSVSPPMQPAADFSFSGRREGIDTIFYSPMGYSRWNDAPRPGTLTITSGKHTRCVKINWVSQVRISDPTTDDKCRAGAVASTDDDPDPE